MGVPFPRFSACLACTQAAFPEEPLPLPFPRIILPERKVKGCFPVRAALPAGTLPSTDGAEPAAACAAQLPSAAPGPPAGAGSRCCSPCCALPPAPMPFTATVLMGCGVWGCRGVTGSFCRLFYWKRQRKLPISQSLCFRRPTQPLVPVPLPNRPPVMLTSCPWLLRLKTGLQKKIINRF